MKQCLFLFIMLLSIFSFGQTTEKDEVIFDKFRKKVVTKNKKLTPEDLNEMVITDRTTSKRSGVQNIYIQQLYKGIEIYNAISSMHLLKTGDVLTLNSQMEDNLTRRIKFNKPGISAVEAMSFIVKERGYSSKKIKVVEATKEGNQQQFLAAKRIAEEPIPAKLIYHKGKERELTLAWTFTIDEMNSSDVWVFFLDAQTGKILHKENRTLN